MTDAADGMFAPLGDRRAEPPHATAPGGRGADDWQPELPAPEELPPAPRHRRLGAPAAVWVYRDAAGRPLFAVCRFDLPGGGKDVLPLTFGVWRATRRWHWKAPPAPRPLYGLDRLAARPDAPVVVLEGEKTADAAVRLFPSYVAVTWQGGGKAVGKADWGLLAGRTVAVWPDNDATGRKPQRRSRRR